MQFKEGTAVYTADGEKVGHIERFVLDPTAQQIIGLVVRAGFLFTEDKVIPVDNVERAQADRVTLKPNGNSPDDYPRFEERHYVEPDKTELHTQYQQAFASPVYYHPPLGVANWYGVVHPTPGVPVHERNIPEGTVAVKEGARVISRDGDHIGNVERVYTDGESVSHISVSRGLFFREEILLPSIWVKTVREDEIYLSVGSSLLKKMNQGEEFHQPS